MQIDWGDGNSSTFNGVAAGGFNYTHQYVDNGGYTIGVTVTDNDGGSVSDSTTVAVGNLEPEILTLAATSVDENGVVHLTGTYPTRARRTRTR